jgi:nod factor export ATP-binding protein I
VVPQEYALYPTLTARENLCYFASLYGLQGKHLQNLVSQGLERVALSQVADRKIKHFSGGMKRRINLLAGILHTPEVLFLDEPTVGVDVMSKNIIIDYLKELNEQGMSILYTSHHMQEAQEFCHRVAILDRGVLLCQGTPKELISQEKVQHLEEVFIRFTSQELAYE